MTEPAPLHLATNVEHLRKAMDLSRGRLAEYLGVTASHVANLEKGRTLSPGYCLIESLACFFGTTCEQLVRVDLAACEASAPGGVHERALRRLAVNFDPAERAMVEDLIDGVTRRQAKEGRFRSSTRRVKLRASADEIVAHG